MYCTVRMVAQRMMCLSAHDNICYYCCRSDLENFVTCETCLYLKRWRQSRVAAVSLAMLRDQPNSREKMRDFMVEFFFMCQISRKIHGSLRNSRKIYGPHSRYFEVLCSCNLRNLSNSTFEISEQRIFIIVITVLSSVQFGTLLKHMFSEDQV